MDKKKILVTGAAGYIGSVLCRQLLNSGHCVKGLDILKFGGESLLGIYNHPNFEFIKGDIRNKNNIEISLVGIDAVVHLAAIVGDPACSMEPDLARETNWEASKMLFELSQKYNRIKNFIFASTCSNYGKMQGEDFVTENSPLNPVSLYAELKVKFEKHILESKTRSDLVPTSLRFATVYGISTRMRFDLTVNEFIRELTFGKKLKIYGEQFWRPYCHVEDLARSCSLILDSNFTKIDHNVFNVGDTKENYQKKMIVDLLTKFIPNARIQYIKKDEDPRDYKVDFSKIRTLLGFETTKTIEDGIREIYKLLNDGLLSDPYSPKYKNL